MRALVLAAALCAVASSASATGTCIPSKAESPLVVETMTRVQEPDMAALAAGRGALQGCGLWSLDIAADGTVKALKAVRVEGGESLRKAVEPWLLTLRFARQDKNWKGLMPVTLEHGGKH